MKYLKILQEESGFEFIHIVAKVFNKWYFQYFDVFISELVLSLDNAKGIMDAASKAQPIRGRNRNQPMAMVTNEKDVAKAIQANVTPSPTRSRTMGIQETGILENFKWSFMYLYTYLPY